MPGRCVRSNAGTYAVRHNPGAYYTDLFPRACPSFDVPYPKSLPRRLQGLTFITPVPPRALALPLFPHTACREAACVGRLGSSLARVLQWRHGISRTPSPWLLAGLVLGSVAALAVLFVHALQQATLVP